MSNKPRISHTLHAEAYPDKLAVYKHSDENCWLVDRGWAQLERFPTFEKALSFALEQIK